MTRTEGARLLGVWLAETDTSAAALGAKVGVSRVTVHHWLHGRIRPRSAAVFDGEVSMRDRIAKATGDRVTVASWDAPLCERDEHSDPVGNSAAAEASA